MKKLSLPLMLLMFGFAEAKSIQNPIWYSISEKILAEAQDLIAPEAKTVKKVKSKSTVNKPDLRCVEKKKEIVLPTPEISLPTNGIKI
jgi:hypothetical protein